MTLRLVKGNLTGEAAVIQTHADGSLTASEWLSAEETEEIIADPSVMRNYDCDYDFSPVDLPAMNVVATYTA